MDEERVRCSIADGCFQTMRSLALVQLGHSGGPTLDRSMKGLTPGRIPRLGILQQDRRRDKTACPFFSADGDRLRCPFRDERITDAGVRAIPNLCENDERHQAFAKNS